MIDDVTLWLPEFTDDSLEYLSGMESGSSSVSALYSFYI